MELTIFLTGKNKMSGDEKLYISRWAGRAKSTLNTFIGQSRIGDYWISVYLQKRSQKSPDTELLW